MPGNVAQPVRRPRQLLVATLVWVSAAALISGVAYAQPAPGPKPGPRPGPRPGATAPTNTTPTPDPIPEELRLPVPPAEPLLPLGYAGDSPWPLPEGGLNRTQRSTVPLPDRWRIGWPTWDRYNRMADNDAVFMNNTVGDSPYTLGHPANPYDRNVLKGDYPIVGDDIFLNATLLSDTLVNFRRLPTPSGVSAANSGSFDFFEDGKQTFVSQTVLLSLDLFQGNTAFRPVDWLVRISPVFNYNYLDLNEKNNVDIDVRDGDDRDDNFTTIQEGFFEYHLGDLSPAFDVAAVRVGRQLFVSDFRGFIFNDVSDGVRFLGNLESNQVQYNLALFNQNEKDTNSELNELNWRDQQVLIANLYVQDFVWKGYTTQFSFHWNHDQSDTEFDNNGFLVIPELTGDVRTRDIDAYYLGWAGDGHIGRLNVNHAFYYVFGEDEHNNLAGRDVDISAFMGALELSIDMDWFRPKLSFLYAGGDDDPEDGTGAGFDGIFDNPFFAGGSSSFYQSQSFRLFGVALHSTRSFFNDLAATKAEGQSNFVNPGTILAGGGFDAELTPKLRTSFNVNSIWFAQTESVELFLNQQDIDSHVGVEVNLAAQFRPLLNNNVIVTVGGSAFWPGDGYQDIYGGDTMLYQVFTGITLSY